MERATNEKLSAALDHLPVVEEHPSQDLKHIGVSLRGTIAHLPEV